MLRRAATARIRQHKPPPVPVTRVPSAPRSTTDAEPGSGITRKIERSAALQMETDWFCVAAATVSPNMSTHKICYETRIKV